MRYFLASVLAVAVCAVMAGAVTFAAIADWVRDLDTPAWTRLGFTDRIPVASTVWRLLVRIDAEELSTVLTASRTPSRPCDSPEPARSEGKPAASPRTWSCH